MPRHRPVTREKQRESVVIVEDETDHWRLVKCICEISVPGVSGSGVPQGSSTHVQILEIFKYSNGQGWKQCTVGQHPMCSDVQMMVFTFVSKDAGFGIKLRESRTV